MPGLPPDDVVGGVDGAVVVEIAWDRVHEAGGVQDECAGAVAQPAGAVVVNARPGDQAVVVDAASFGKRPVSAQRWVNGIEPGVEINGCVAGVVPPERGPESAPGAGRAVGQSDDEAGVVDVEGIAVVPRRGYPGRP